MTESDARDELLAKLDPHSPFWQAFEAWAEARRTAIGVGLLRAGAESVETARGKASVLTEILAMGEEKRENLKSKGEPPSGD